MAALASSGDLLTYMCCLDLSLSLTMSSLMSRPIVR